jgi:hypothetical protein
VFVRDKDDRLDEVVIALRSNEVAEAACELRCDVRAERNEFGELERV